MPDQTALIGQTLERVWPILLFLILVKVLADLFDDAGLFDAAAHRIARWGRGRTLWLYLLFVGLCTLATSLLSLDTTAVLMTPLAIHVAREVRVDPWPFALGSLWLANTTSLLLPMGNLTNLLAMHRLGTGTGGFVELMWAPQLAVLVVTVVWLLLRHRRSITGRYVPPRHLPRHDRVLVPLTAALTALLGAAVVAGVAPWLATGVTLLVTVAAFAWRSPHKVRPGRLARLAPWPMAAFALALFLAVGALEPWFAPRVVSLVTQGDGSGALLQIAGAGALSANAINNLPAYLGLEPLGTSGPRLAALLVGVNAGPLVTPWASLATLLWLQACRSRRLPVSLPRLALEGLAVVPLALLAGVAAIALAA
ncbi:SLC13 family permease [Actinomycetota bacterium]